MNSKTDDFASVSRSRLKKEASRAFSVSAYSVQSRHNIPEGHRAGSTEHMQLAEKEEIRRVREVRKHNAIKRSGGATARAA